MPGDYATCAIAEWNGVEEGKVHRLESGVEIALQSGMASDAERK